MPGMSAARLRPLARTFGPAAVVIAVQQVAFPSTGPDGAYQWGPVLRGVTLGVRSGLVALGMALTCRAHRVVNFAQGSLGPFHLDLGASEIWWDPDVEADDEFGSPGEGVWRRAHDGERFVNEDDAPAPDPFDPRHTLTIVEDLPEADTRPAYPPPPGSPGARTDPREGAPS